MLIAVIAMGSYEALHYASASWVFALGADGTSLVFDRHAIGGKPFPHWAERYFFWPAERIGDLFRDRPWNPWPLD